MMQRFAMNLRYEILLLALLAGCFYPAQTPAPPIKQTSATIDVPYDLAWNAVHSVVISEGAHIVTENPDAGAIEFQTVGGFTLADADCGRVRGIGGKINAEPDPDSSSVFDIKVAPEGRRITRVSIVGTFTAPLHVPLHPMSDVQCVSRGVQEARLLKRIEAQALLEHRPGSTPAGAGVTKDSP